MDYLISLIIAIVGGVTCHYIIKWLEKRFKQQLARKGQSCNSVLFIFCVSTTIDYRHHFPLPKVSITYLSKI